MTDTRPPSILAGEKDTLLAFLAYLRTCLIAKLDGISPTRARTPGVPSGTHLLGLVKHVTSAEAFWIHHVFAGLDHETAIPDDEVTAADTPESAIAAYRQVAATTADLLAPCHDLDARATVAPFGPPTMSLRWILVHMIEETGRHAGHADILREQLDGTVGR